MNKELDIAAILRDKPKGTKLWSPAFGDVKITYIRDNNLFSIQVIDEENNIFGFSKYGKLSRKGETILFPSKEMRDWEKFAWKKGEVLTDGKRHVIFKCWDNNDYTLFFATFEYKSYDSFRQNLVLNTNEFTKSSDNVAKIVIKKVEEHYDGKLNLKTLEIEKPNPQFKDGDVVAFSDGYGKYNILVFERIEGNYLYSHTSLSSKGELMPCRDFYEINAEWSIKNRYLRLATEEEKQQLFSALEKKGKTWSAEKKAIVDLSKKHVFKPFDKVLMRDNKEDEWKPFFFLKEKDGAIFPYYCINDNENRKYCIPYEGNEHLLGTTDSPKEGGENG